MKKYKLLSISLIALWIGLSMPSCEEESTFKIEEDQEIIFHYSYENFAGGYQYAGWCIDKEGVVWDLEEPLHWNEEVTNILKDSTAIFWYDRDDLEQEYETARGRVLGKIRNAEMDKRIDQIEDILYESYSLADSIMEDAGSAIYGFLSYDSGKRKYRKVILELSGDWYSFLDDESAGELLLWMRDIQKDIGYPDYK